MYSDEFISGGKKDATSVSSSNNLMEMSSSQRPLVHVFLIQESMSLNSLDAVSN